MSYPAVEKEQVQRQPGEPIEGGSLGAMKLAAPRRKKKSFPPKGLRHVDDAATRS